MAAKMVSESPNNPVTRDKHRHQDIKCQDKARDRMQLTFTLVEQDMSSPHVILDWIKYNLKTCPNDKLIEAFECALVMKDSTIQKKAAD